MLKKDELKIVKLLLSNLSGSMTISDLSRELGQKYVQTYRTVKTLVSSKNVQIKSVGNSKIVLLGFTELNPNYVIAELQRQKDVCRNKQISVIRRQIVEANMNVVCVLFGSQATKPSKTSDIDLLMIIPDEYNYSDFDKKIRRQFSAYNCDINIVTEDGLLKLWSTPNQFNVGNELLRNHVVLYGAEHFLNILRKHHVG